MHRFCCQATCAVGSTRRLAVIVALSSCALLQTIRAEVPRVLPPGQRPDDMRLGPLKDLKGYFPFRPAESAEAWQERARKVRRRMLVALGLWPMPTRTPLKAVIHGRIEQDDYTVEKVYFQSMPGLFVTGNLYRPRGALGKRPGVLCPHGHWHKGNLYGRFYDAGLEAVRKQIVIGAERFEQGGRSPLQARCVQLARMGCVVFHYDMLGYADSQQISFQLAHRFAKQRPEMNTEQNWGLFSPQAESHLQSVMGLQTWNGIRSLDFLESLPDVDPRRLAVTGASGGGTQTMILGAIDPRPAVSMPCVMVSTAMQGGCTCENACLLRIGTGNVEFAALFAPKPLGLTAADDWTKEMSTKGFPELKQHYRMLGAEKNVMLASLTHFRHNYNHVSRAAMYSWFNRHLKLGFQDPILERDYQRLAPEELTVWDDQHPQPEGGPDFERRLLRWWHDDAQQQLARLVPTDRKSLRAWRELVGGAVDVMIGRGLPEPDTVQYEPLDQADLGRYRRVAGLLRHRPPAPPLPAEAAESPERNGKGGKASQLPSHEELPVLCLDPEQWDATAVIWVDDRGKSGLFQQNGDPRPEIARLLSAGASVVGADLFEQGEFRPDGKPLERTRRVDNPREFAGYTFGYNHTVFSQRVHDILSLITFVRRRAPRPAERVYLVGLGGAAGALVAAARAQAGGAVTGAAVDTSGFRFGKVQDIHDPNFLPGGAKYYDLPGILSLSAPHPLWLAGETEQALAIVRAAYRAADAQQHLTISDEQPQARAAAVVQWLLSHPD